MKWLVVSVAITVATPVVASAQAKPETNNSASGAQNAVSNQNPTSQLGLVSETPPLSNAATNATNNQQPWNATMDASTTQGVSEMYGPDSAPAIGGISQVLAQDGRAPPPQADAGTKPNGEAPKPRPH